MSPVILIIGPVEIKKFNAFPGEEEGVENGNSMH